MAPAGGAGLPNGLTNSAYTSDLRAQTQYSYDDQGRVYQTSVFSVQPVTRDDAGTVGPAVTTNIYYDHRGDVMVTESPTGLWTKSFYDGAGRLIEQDQTNGAGGNSWAVAGSITGDVVLSQQVYSYDGDDNLIETIDKDRLATDSTSGTGALGSTSAPARVSYSASFYDAAVDGGVNQTGLKYNRKHDLSHLRNRVVKRK